MQLPRTVLTMLLALGLASAQVKPTPQARPAPQTHKRPTTGTAPKLSDPDLEKAIRARFARSKIGVNHFTVRVQGGIATIEGKTDVIQHKATATRLARSAGAATVVNRIQISEAARQSAAANLAQGRRRAQVKRGETRTQAR
jgi:hypothetical protein